MSGKIINIFTLTAFCMISTQIMAQNDLKSAISLTESEQFDAAKKIYLNLIQKEPAVGDNYFFMGENYIFSYFVDSVALSLKEMCDSAMVYYRKGAEVDPLNPINFVGMGKVVLFKNDTARARGYFEQAFSLLPSKKNKASKVPKNVQALVYAKIGEAYTQATMINLDYALTLLLKAIELDATNPKIFIILGDVYLEKVDGSNAILYYKKAQDLNPKSTVAKTKIGNIYVRVKNLQEAIPFFEEALKINSNFAPVYREFGDLYYKAGKYDKSIAMYEKYVELNNTTQAKAKLATIYFLAKEYEKSIKLIKEVQSVDSSSNVLNRIATYNCYELNQIEEALKYSNSFFRRTIPEKIIASDYTYLGRIMAKMEKDSVAIVNLQKAFQMDSSDCDILSEIANIYLKDKKYIEAAVAYERKIICNPAVMDYYNLGKAYYNLQQYEKADTAFGAFLAKNPSSMQGLKYKAYSRTGMDDSLSTKGLAVPYYYKVIEKGLTDSVKYSKDLIESYFFLVRYNVFNTKDLKEAKRYLLKIVALDPKNKDAQEWLNTKELKAIKL